uniref:1-aminocyclopropane-1-carboxylate synthase-like protein 1 n=1 Tax=Oreochromis niloticus TaxID=8128 RepID=A0A669E7S4_ORENI
MLTGVLLAVREGTQTTTQSDPATSPLARFSASLMTTPAPSAPSSSSQPPPEAPTTESIFNQETKKSQLTSVKACKMSQNALETLRGEEGPGNSVYLSERGNSIRLHEGILQEGYIQYGMDRHHDTDNPDGIINMGTSENKLFYDDMSMGIYLLLLIIMNYSACSLTKEIPFLLQLTKPDMLHINPSLLQYSDWRGHAFLREAVAKFLTHYCCSPNPLKADNVGIAFIIEIVCTVNAILIPTPFYGVITEDLHLYSDVKLFHVPLDCEADGKDNRPFRLTVGKLEEGLQRAKEEGLTIRGVILMNPHNPLAEIYSLKEMITFLEFAKRNALHAIVDEVYMLTVFDESVTFQSVLSADSLPDPQRTHVMWGMSKDFAMAGIRIGTLYTENRDLVEALAKLGSFHGVPGTTQHQVAQLLQDKEWINEEFLPENRRRLKAACSYMTGELLSMGIPFLDRPATLYVWADLRKYLQESSFEEELSLWKCFLRHKVLLSCGQAFCCSVPGWFRIVFADQQHHLQLGQYQQHSQCLLARLFMPSQQPQGPVSCRF